MGILIQQKGKQRPFVTGQGQPSQPVIANTSLIERQMRWHFLWQALKELFFCIFDCRVMSPPSPALWAPSLMRPMGRGNKKLDRLSPRPLGEGLGGEGLELNAKV